MDRIFGISQQGSTLRTEALAGTTTFLAMAYILFVNPDILGSAGMDPNAVFVATALASALGTLTMGLLANYPIALAPGMGLNAYFAFTVVLGMGIAWQTALVGTLISGVLFLILAVSGARRAIVEAIPLYLKMATGAGIGLFIAFIGLRNAGIVVPDEATTVALGDLSERGTLVAVLGVLITAVLMIRGFRGGVFYGLVATAVLAVLFGVAELPDAVVSPIPSLSPTFLAVVEGFDGLWTQEMVAVVLTMLFVDFFDTSGTLIAVANQAGLLKDGRLPRANRALAADSSATIVGSLLGTSTTTSYIESTAGVSAGGRTGMTSVVTAGFFVLALFFSPLLTVVTSEVTAPALIIVGVLMAKSLGQIAWDQIEVAIPAFATIIAMPLTFSIATGIAFGLLLHPLLMIAKGRWRDIHWIGYLLFAVVLAWFIWLT